MTREGLTTFVGIASIVCSGLALAIALVTLGYLLRVWEERRERGSR